MEMRKYCTRTRLLLSLLLVSVVVHRRQAHSFSTQHASGQALFASRTKKNNRVGNDGFIEKDSCLSVLTVSSTCNLRTRGHHHHVVVLYSASVDHHQEDEDEKEDAASVEEEESNDSLNIDNDIIESSSSSPRLESRRKQIRQRVRQLAKNMVVKPIESVAPMPKAIAEVLKDATVGAVDSLVAASSSSSSSKITSDMDRAFDAAELALQQAQESLVRAQEALNLAKVEARTAIEKAEDAALVEATRAVQVAQQAQQVVTEYVASGTSVEDVSTLTYDEVGYHFCEDMGPPFLDAEMCLVPGEAVVRVEKARENSRRIFAGIDIMASVDDVWKVLTDYKNLQKVVPNLVVNEVMELYNYDKEPPKELRLDSSLSDVEQCQTLSKEMRGAKLRQVGGAKVVGINFSARTTLEVREWPCGMPDFAHFKEDVYEGKSRDERAKENAKIKLQRYRFPRPFALSKLPTRDISMQSIKGDDGEFRLYQGVWRMQPLPGCAPQGKQAMRLTYAVEVSPRAYLPVSLVEGRIVQDLCTNLAAIRDFVSDPVLA